MLKMLALVCHTGFGPTTHELTEALENARGVADQRYSHSERAPAVRLQRRAPKHTPNILDVPEIKNQGDSGMVDDLATIPAPSVGSVKVISGSVIEIGWGAIMHEPHASTNIQRHSMQQLWQSVFQKMSVSRDIESMRQNVWLYETVTNNTSPNVN
jgi:hypothetical protein